MQGTEPRRLLIKATTLNMRKCLLNTYSCPPSRVQLYYVHEVL